MQVINLSKLKKYRGLLLGQAIDQMNLHDTSFTDHEAGRAPTECKLCHQIKSIQTEVTRVSALIDGNNVDEKTNQPMKIERRYFYLFKSVGNGRILVRAKNLNQAMTIMKESKYQRAPGRVVRRITQSAADKYLKRVVVGGSGIREFLNFNVNFDGIVVVNDQVVQELRG